MKALVLLSTVVLLACTAPVAHAQQSAGKKFLITVQSIDDRSGKPFTTGELKAVAEALSNEVRKQLRTRFPCGTVLTQDDVRTLALLQRDKELLGVGDDRALEALAGAVGANFLVALTIRQGNGRVYVNGAQLDTRKATATARESHEVPAGTGPDDALEEILGFAEEFVGGPVDQSCNPWSGTVTYSFTQEGHKVTPQSGDMKLIETFTTNLDYTIRIPESGRPTVSITYKHRMSGERAWTYEVNCLVSGRGGFNGVGVTKGGNAQDIVVIEESGGGSVPIDVRITGTESELRVSVEGVKFDTAITQSDKRVRTAFCGSDDPNRESPGLTSPSTQAIRPPAIPALRLQPGQNSVQGEFPPAGREQPSQVSGERTITRTTWTLRRTGSPVPPR